LIDRDIGITIAVVCRHRAAHTTGQQRSDSFTEIYWPRAGGWGYRLRVALFLNARWRSTASSAPAIDTRAASDNTAIEDFREPRRSPIS